jgi:hypothetical protein
MASGGGNPLSGPLSVPDPPAAEPPPDDWLSMRRRGLSCQCRLSCQFPDRGQEVEHVPDALIVGKTPPSALAVTLPITSESGSSARLDRFGVAVQEQPLALRMTYLTGWPVACGAGITPLGGQFGPRPAGWATSRPAVAARS